MQVVAFDCETKLIGPDQVIPDLVCVTLYDGENELLLVPWEDDIQAVFEGLLQDEDVHLVGHHTSFDSTVICKALPALEPLFWEAYAEERIHDTKLQEQLHNLATTGNLSHVHLPDGSSQPIFYTLDSLGQRHLGIDRSEQKEGDDIWRLRYAELIDVPSEEWPEEATRYALDDAIETYDVFKAQTPYPLNAFHAAADFALKWMTYVGMAIDPDMKAALQVEVDMEMDYRNFELLRRHMILTDPIPARPHARDVRDHVEDCPKTKVDGQWACDCPPKMTAAIPSKKKFKALKAFVYEVCKEHGREVALTNKGKEFMYAHTRQKVSYLPADHAVWEDHPEFVSTKSSFMARIVPLSPVLKEWDKRSEKEKLKTTYLPALEWEGETAPRVHFPFNPLVSSGRTSSVAGKNKLYPSTNGQNVDPRVRPCFIPDAPGNVIISIDYASLELRMFAQTCLNTVGFSVLAERYQDDPWFDAHAYLGAQLAYEFDSDFREACDAEFESGDREGYFRAFRELKTRGGEGTKFFKHFRKFAKPVGLGFPGGLGAETMIEFAWGAPYRLELTLAEAERAKAVWLATYPEAGRYFQMVNNERVDQVNFRVDEETGRKKLLYAYTTPLGMRRAGCVFTEAANGEGLQSPSSEGAKIALFNCTRAWRDTTVDSPLRKLVAIHDFIHDELLFQARYVGHEEECLEIIEAAVAIMEESMQAVCPDVPIKAEPAMAWRWYKEMDPVFEDAKLIPWTPETQD